MKLQEPKQIQIEDYIEIILRRKWFIIIPFIASIIGIILTLFITPPMYKSMTLILIDPQKVPTTYVKPTVAISIKDRLNAITEQVMSRTRLESIIKELNLYREQREKVTTEEVVGLMRKHIQVNVAKGNNSFTVSYIGYEPETVMHVTNRLASLFIEENLKVREQQAEGTTEFLDSQLQNLRDSLEQQEAQIKAFKEKYMGELPTQLDANLRTLDRLQLELKATNDNLKGAEEMKINLETQLSEGNLNFREGAGSGSKDSRRSRLAALQERLSQLSAIYTDKYPDIIGLKNEIAQLEKELIGEKLPEDDTQVATESQGVKDNPLYKTISRQLMDVNTNIKNLKEKQKELTKNIALFQGRVERIPTRELQMADLLRDYENTKTNYHNLLNKKLDAQLTENLEKRQKGEQFRIIDPASFPVKPFKPDPMKIIIIGITIGLGSGGGLVFLLEYIDASFRKAEDVYSTLGLPVLASVPKIRIGIR